MRNHKAAVLEAVIREAKEEGWAEGRREGLEKALLACREMLTADRCENAIRKLMEAT